MSVESGSPTRAATLLVVAVALLVGTASLATAWRWLAPEQVTVAAPVGTSTSAPLAEGWAAWDHNDDGEPVSWDACSPIELVVDPEGAYPGFRQDLAEAVGEVADLTGLDLVVRGEVSERPDARREVYQPSRYGERWAPVLVAFAAPGENDLPLADVDRGLAAPVAVGPEGDRVYVTGQVVLNAERDDLLPGSEDRASSWGSTLRHELGHVLGLAHVDDEQELMHRVPHTGAVVWGDGDRRGLRALGAGDCRELPTPQPLDVELGTPR